MDCIIIVQITSGTKTFHRVRRCSGCCIHARTSWGTLSSRFSLVFYRIFLCFICTNWNMSSSSMLVKFPLTPRTLLIRGIFIGLSSSWVDSRWIFITWLRRAYCLSELEWHHFPFWQFCSSSWYLLVLWFRLCILLLRVLWFILFFSLLY
jgi:hypothetical protein